MVESLTDDGGEKTGVPGEIPEGERPTYYVAESQHSDTRPTSSGIDPTMPGACRVYIRMPGVT